MPSTNSMPFTNNVTRMLDGKNVAYSVHAYEYGEETHSATDVALAIGKPPAQVFKTLVATSGTSGEKPVLVVIPGPDTLDRKRLAKEMGVKKMQMTSRAQAESTTGLLAGGISPLALINRGFRTYLARQATDYDRIYISAGERGAQIGIAPDDLVRLTNARLIDLA